MLCPPSNRRFVQILLQYLIDGRGWAEYPM
jgi:hypothetical protein